VAVKVCLISAPTANDFDDPAIAELDALRVIAEHAPLGILSLAAVLERQGLQPEIIDLNRLYYECLRSDEFKRGEIDFTGYAARYFVNRRFDLFGFSTICSSYPLTLRIAKEVKCLHPEAVIALGGPQASVVDGPTMRAYPFVDLILRGEAEHTLPAVLDAQMSGRQPGLIPGVTYRLNGRVMRNDNAPLILDLDALPFPAYHLYPHTKACSYLPLELGRGCPFACTFCSTNDFFRRKFRLKTPQHMLAEMRRVKQDYGIQTFDLVHDMFTVDRKRVVAFCEALLESGEKFHWGCSARTDCIDDELIELLSQAGCSGLFFGIETGSPRLQRIVKKDLDLLQAAERVRTCDRFEIKTAVSLITGFPEENMDDLRDTIHFFMDSLRYDYADPQLCILAPLADTPIYKDHKDHLVFDDVISDMSFQGWRQDPADCEMIAEHPDIFCNFYSVPTPFLDRRLLKEIREFILNAMQAFRWLLIGVHQDSGDLVTVFLEWRSWRAKHKAPFPENNPTIYYPQPAFHSDFLEFLRTEYLPNRSKCPEAIKTLADYEATFARDNSKPESLPTEKTTIQSKTDAAIALDSRPRKISSVHITELDADYHEIVKQLREKQPLNRVVKREVTLVTRLTQNRGTEVLQLSPLSAELLRLCEGKATVAEIAGKLASRGLQVPGVPDEATCLFGVELLRCQGLLELSN
jgi:radical SAM superfamily enzyme YgiQ (UPF0313 family)